MALRINESDIRRGRIAVCEVEIVTDKLDDDGYIECISSKTGASCFIDAKDIVVIKDKPYNPEVGHVVTWGAGTFDYTVIAIDDGTAWLRYKKDGTNAFVNLSEVKNLRRVS
jgi:hypothetical protein